MDSEELMMWMKQKNLLAIAKAQMPHLKNVLTNSLNLKKEAVMIIGDYGQENRLCAPIMTAAYYLACQSLRLDVALIMQGVKSRETEADERVRFFLKRLKKDNAVVLSLSNRLGKLKDLGKLREFAKKKGHKYLSTTGLIGLETDKVHNLTDAININYRKIDKAAERIKEELDWAREIRIMTLAGTKLKIDVKGQNADTNTGYVRTRGEGENIPAGEVYVAPTMKGVEGELIIDGSSRHKHGTMLINKPIKMTIKQGMITNIEGGQEAKTLKDSVDWIKNRVKQPSTSSMIGELGIGINPKAKIIGSTIIDEKAYGTAHIGIGGNYWFGGHVFSSLHLDQVFKNPIITIDGKELKLPRKSELE
ncbi:MAG: aminopeptidase [Candidatus Nanoarchaeia archaeon]